MEYLKWYRGAMRWNNGATIYGRKYQFRVIMGWASMKKQGHFSLKDYQPQFPDEGK